MEILEEIRPSTDLAPYIRYYWILQTDSSIEVVQRIVPTGCIQLLFHRGELIRSSSGKGFLPQSFFGGQTVSYSDITPVGKVDMVVVVFHPHGAKAFFRMPMDKLYDTEISVDDMEDPPLKDLGNRVAETFDNRAAIDLIEQYFRKQLYSIKEYNFRRINAAVGAANLQSSANVSSLAEVSCLSNKQFNRIFSEYVGINPKEFLRVLRFQRTLYILQTHPEMSLTQVAFECGYYDQPHLIKEFKSFTGYTPGEYIAICSPYSDYFSNL